jgi:DNA-binding transcriptional regulator YiaG
MTTETKSQFALRLGVNKSTVTRWQQAGRQDQRSNDDDRNA